MLYYFLVLYVFLRQGHCAQGWKSPNTNQEKLEDCRNECAKRSNIGYFAYSTSKTCACYLADDGCPDDDAHKDHNAYRIVGEGICLLNNLSRKCVSKF